MSEQINFTLTAEQTAPTAADAPRPPRRPAQQSRSVAETITRADELLTLIATDAELSDLLAAFGYDARSLEQGRALQTAAHQAYQARQQAIAAKQLADGNALLVANTVRRAFTDYRQVARTLLKTPSERTALGLKGALPYDLQEMIQLARTAYQAALSDAAALEVLTSSGYSAAKLQAALAGLDDAIAANNAQAAARTTAIYTTRQRREAFDALETWLVQFRAVARIATRERPDLAARIA